VKNITSTLLLLALMLATAPIFFSCSDKDDDKVNEYENWKSRNESYFSSIRTEAKSAINKAKASYGDNWEEHCEWKTYLSYSLSPTATTNKSTDSIYVKIVNSGTGSGCPMGSDSVRVFYYGKLIPTVSHTNGYMFDHSGQSSVITKIFDRSTSVPASLKVTGTVRGFATALQQMHIGDRWIIYVPYELGYLTAKDKIPQYSTLTFEVELVQYARNGTSLPAWR